MKDQVQVYDVEIPGAATSSTSIHLLCLFHISFLLSFAHLVINWVSLLSMEDFPISNPLSFSGASPQSYGSGMVSWSLPQIYIFIIFSLAFHVFRSFLVWQKSCLSAAIADWLSDTISQRLVLECQHELAGLVVLLFFVFFVGGGFLFGWFFLVFQYSVNN